MLGIGIGINVTTVGRLSLPTIINGMAAGQSLIDYTDFTALVNALPAGSQFFESAVGGKPLSKTVGDQTADEAWVNDDDPNNLVDDHYLTQYIAEVDTRYTNRTDVNAVIHQNVTSSRNFIREAGGAGYLTGAEYQVRLQWLYDRFRALHGADTLIVAGLPHRYLTGNAQEDEGFQLMREAIIAIAEADPLIKIIEYPDLDLTDNVHLTAAHTTVQAQRFAAQINNHFNGGPAQIYPVAQSAVIDDYEITVTFDNDISLPSSGFGQIKVREGNANMVIDSIAIGDNDNELVITMTSLLTEANAPEVYIGYGTNADLPATGADLLMNAAGTLPARGSVNAITGTFPTPAQYTGSVITDLAAVRDYVVAGVSTLTFNTAENANNVETASGLKGNGLIRTTYSSGINPGLDYDPTAFGGLGGFKQLDGQDGFLQMALAKTTGPGTYFFALDIPPSTVGTSIGGIGILNGASAGRAYLFQSTHRIRYARAEPDDWPNIKTSTSNTRQIVCVRYTDNDLVEFFVSSTAVTYSLNPNNQFNYNCIYLGSQAGSANGVQGMVYDGFVFGDSTFSDQDVATVMNELGTRYGVTIAT